MIYSASRRGVKTENFYTAAFDPSRRKDRLLIDTVHSTRKVIFQKVFFLHIGAALPPANETRRFFIDHRPLKEKKKSCVDGVETRIGLTVERAAGNLETRSRIQDRNQRGLRIKSQ